MIKNYGILTVFIMAAVLLLSGCSGQADKSDYSGPVEKITLAAYEGDTGLLPYIAENQGFFEKNGLDVEIIGFESGKAAADALIAGQADISTSADAVLVANSFNNPDLRILGTAAIEHTNGLIARKDRGIAAGSDLRGKRVGVTKKSAGEFNLGVFLIFNGLSIKDLEIIDLSPSEIVDAVVSGDVDAGFTWGPNLLNAKTQLGDNALLLKENVPKVFFLILSKKEWIDNNPEAAGRFIRVLIQAEEYARQNEDDARQFMKQRFNYGQDYSDSIWGEHDFSVVLSQELLIKLEDIARWRIENKLTDAEKIPNYLDYVYVDALEDAKPNAVTIIR